MKVVLTAIMFAVKFAFDSLVQCYVSTLLSACRGGPGSRPLSAGMAHRFWRWLAGCRRRRAAGANPRTPPQSEAICTSRTGSRNGTEESGTSSSPGN